MQTDSADILKQESENKMIQDAFQHLLDTYLASPHKKKVEIITKAFNFARNAHKGAKRLSGEPYIMHPIAVAQIACEEMGLGSTSICAALLHDVVEDTEFNIDDIQSMFGDKIAQIVEGLTKISGGIFGEQASQQAENFKKLLLTMNEDIRVVLIKICDRLHNMRTLQSQLPNKKYKIAGETRYIYAPLASRLGLYKIKTELENLCFKFEHPEEYQNIKQKLKFTQEEREQLFDDFTKPIREILDKDGFEYQLKARVKSPYSIWNKMQNKHLDFNDIYDILAVRIIFTPKVAEREVEETLYIYAALTKIYKPHPDRTRIWLTQPKNNGYQALHVTLMSKQGQWVEVQIRSRRMDLIDEKGLAAHWHYKHEVPDNYEEDKLTPLIHDIKEILDDPHPNPTEFLDAVKMNLYASEIVVFTPKGDSIRLPLKSTVLDFAFHIHTVLGNHCVGAKVNHKMETASYQLHSGDQVEILTSATQHAKEEWLDFAVTAKAKNKIKAILRRYNRELQKKGEEQLTQWLQSKDLQPTTQLLEKMCKANHITKLQQLYLAIGKGTVILDNKQYTLLQEQNKTKNNWLRKLPFIHNQKANTDNQLTIQNNLFVVGKDFNKKIPVVIDETAITLLKFPHCCHPIPGDDILGYIDDNNNIEIHLRNCPQADRLKVTNGNRILDAKWDMHRKILFHATLTIEGIDRKGLLLDVAKVISQDLNVDIQSLTLGAQEEIFRGNIQLKVYDRNDMKRIMQRLNNIQGLQNVQSFQTFNQND